MLQSTVMQSLDPPQRPLPSETDDAFIVSEAPLAGPPVPETAVAPEVDGNGHGAYDAGSAAYVTIWDGYARQSVGADARRRREQNLRLAREVIETGIFALIMFLGVRMVVQNFRVEGLSMDPTYRTGQYVLVNKVLYTRFNLKAIADRVPFWSSDDEGRYLFRRPHRGDVVVFEPPLTNSGDRDFIKRVIGEPGDRVTIRDGQITVNGHVLEERYLPGIQTTCFGQYCDVTLGVDEYFVLGDNRANSSDSRYWGAVKGDKIIGRSWLIYLPFSDFGPAPNGAPALLATGTGQAP